ncbi:MAG: homoserine dehydrogenase [Kiritimatiellia bacterium]
MRKIGIGLLGFGTVGVGVVEILLRNGQLLAQRAGAELVLHRVADLDLERDRGVTLDRTLLTRDAKAVIDDPDTTVVVELIGGTGAAREFILRALERGKPVVTANKALLAEYGAEIFDLVRKKAVDLYFGASVGGGIGIVRALREGLIANHIRSINAILNGTCNYILTSMEELACPFDKALAMAKAAGYAEANPALDIDGIDTAHKAVILASLAYGRYVPLRSVHVEGICEVSETDIRYARELGYRIKLLAVVRQSEEGVEVRVHPTLVPLNHVLSSVSGVFNAVLIQADFAGDVLYYGQGAGRNPTASTVVADIVDVARNIISGAPHRLAAVSPAGGPIRIRDMNGIQTRCYLRLALLDRPGVLAQIAAILGGHGISLSSVLQKETRAGDYVPVVILTHAAPEMAFTAALEEINRLSVVGGKAVRIRLMDEGKAQ